MHVYTHCQWGQQWPCCLWFGYVKKILLPVPHGHNRSYISAWFCEFLLTTCPCPKYSWDSLFLPRSKTQTDFCYSFIHKMIAMTGLYHPLYFCKTWIGNHSLILFRPLTLAQCYAWQRRQEEIIMRCIYELKWST